MKPRLLVLDDYEGELAAASGMARMREMADVTILDRPLTDSDLPMLGDFQFLFALRERTQMDAAFFEACQNLELLLQSGGHAFHADTAEATKRGIVISLGRGATRTTKIMPELTFSLILGLMRRIYPITQQMQQGQWPEVIGQSVYGRTLGILGYGRHGKPIGKIARLFGMKIVAWDRGGDYSADEEDVVRLPLEDLLATSDIVSVHLKLSDASRGLLTGELLAKMKPTALFINTSRGAIVDEAALYELLRDEKIAGAGLDVFAVEPLSAESPLRTLPNVLLTPHIGWKVNIMLQEWVDMAADQLAAWLDYTLDPGVVLDTSAMRVARPRSGGIKA